MGSPDDGGGRGGRATRRPRVAPPADAADPGTACGREREPGEGAAGGGTAARTQGANDAGGEEGRGDGIRCFAFASFRRSSCRLRAREEGGLSRLLLQGPCGFGKSAGGARGGGEHPGRPRRPARRGPRRRRAPRAERLPRRDEDQRELRLPRLRWLLPASSRNSRQAIEGRQGREGLTAAIPETRDRQRKQKFVGEKKI